MFLRLPHDAFAFPPTGVNPQYIVSLNPAALKRNIDAKLAELYQVYEKKGRTQHADPHKKLVPHKVRSYMIQQSPVGLDS